MRRLLWLVIGAALLWSAWWVIGAQGVKAGLSTWFEARRSEGWQAESSTIKLRGFPNRFDATIEDLALADPASGFEWRAPFVQIFALSYRPDHIILTLAPTQQITAPTGDKITVDSNKLQGSVVFAPTTDLAPIRATFVAENLQARSLDGWGLTLPKAQLSVRHTLSAEYDLALDATQARISGIFPAEQAEEKQLELHLDANVGLHAPLNRFTIEDQPPQPRFINLRFARAEWGQLALNLSGRLDFNAAGQPEGQLHLRTTNWRKMLDLGESMSLLQPEMRPTIERSLSLLAKLSDGPETLEVMLNFAGGSISFGPVPINHGASSAREQD